MIFILTVLIISRLFFWRLFPAFGTGLASDLVFSTMALGIVVLYNLVKIKSPMSLPIVIWYLGSYLSVFYSQNMPNSLCYLFTMSLNIVVFILIIKFLKSRAQLEFIWNIIVLSAIVSAIIGIKEYFILRSFDYIPGLTATQDIVFNLKRSCSLQGWPTGFAGFLILVIPYALFNCHWLIIWILILGLMSSFSVIPVLSLSAAFVITKYQKYYIWLVLIVIASILFLTKSWESFSMTRLAYYAQAWDMVTKHPIIGNGLGTFICKMPAPSVYVHNSYFQIWAESGVLGLIGIVGLFIAVLRMTPSMNPWEIGLYIGIVSVFLDNFFSFTLLKPNLAFIWWIALGVYNNIQQRRYK